MCFSLPALRRVLSLSLAAASTLLAPLAFAGTMEDYPAVQLRALDKITARTLTFQADVGSTVKFGSLYVKVQACRKAPPIEQPESAAFLQIWEEIPDQEAASLETLSTHPEWVFSGWMFASSPALSYMDHPIYDVWVLDCLKEAKDAVEGEALAGEGTVTQDDAEIPEAAEIPDEAQAPLTDSADEE